MTGAQMIMQVVADEGTTAIFGYSGGAILPTYDAVFLYNADALTATLRNAGFAEVRFVEYGSSGNPDLAGLEHHERYPDEASMPHVLCAEASGRRETAARDHDAIIAEYERDAAVR